MKYSGIPNISGFTILVLTLILSAGFLSAQEIDEVWALEYLLAEEELVLDNEIAFLESDAGIKAFPDADARALGLGSLYVFKYIRFDEVSKYAYTASDHLDELNAAAACHPGALGKQRFATPPLAQSKTAFGVGDLRDMERAMKAIPVDYEGWIVRFLRGTTMYQVSQALPKIFFRKAAAEAFQLGANDLLYVETEYYRNGVSEYDPETYDEETRPVPREIFEQVRALYSE